MRPVTLVAAALAVACATVCAAAPEGEQYSSRYDNVDLQGLLQDQEKVEGILNCFLANDDTNCSEMAGRIKKVLGEMLPGDCAKCNDAQKAGLAKTVKFLAAKKPQKWAQLQDKYDAQKLYAQAHPDLFQ